MRCSGTTAWWLACPPRSWSGCGDQQAGCKVSLVTLRGRTGVRRRLGLPSDTTDELVIAASQDRPVALSDQRNAAVDTADLVDAIESGRIPRQTRRLVFQRTKRAGRAGAGRTRTTRPTRYYARRPSNGGATWPPRAYRRSGWFRRSWRTSASSRSVPRKSPLDSVVKTRYETIPEQRVISWPPPRNALLVRLEGEVQEVLRPSWLTDGPSLPPRRRRTRHR